MSNTIERRWRCCIRRSWRSDDERGIVVLTTNLAFSGWETIFKNPMTTAAAIDRLVHHSVILELNVPSYRAEQAKKAGQMLGPVAPSKEV